MRVFTTIILGLLMLATLGVLVAGMVGMVRGGNNPQRSNKLMQYRVALQAAALAVLAIIMLALRP